jgi:hypothetical protein
MSILMWIVTIASSLGVIGAIAACILVPAVAIPILQSIVSAILKCKPCLIALAIFASLFVGALYGSHVATAKCKAGQLAAQLHNKQIDLDVASETAKEADMARSESADRAVQSEKKVAEYAKALKDRPNSACILGVDDFPERLRVAPWSK